MEDLKNMLNKKEIIIILVLIVLIGGLYLFSSKGINEVSNNVGEKDTHGCISSEGFSWCEVQNKCINLSVEKCEVVASSTKTATPTKKPETISPYASKCGFTVMYPTIGARVSFPLTIKGMIDNSKADKLGCSWSQVLSRGGEAQVFYYQKSKGWIAPGIPVPIMTGSGVVASTTAFTIPFNVYTTALGLPSGTPIKFSFTEQKAPGITTLDSFEMTVYLK